MSEIFNQVTAALGMPSITFELALRVVVLFLVGLVIIRILLTMVDRLLERSQNMAPVRAFIRSIIKVLLYFILVLVLAGSVGIEVTSVIALLSVAGLAVSLALQNTLSNVAGGIMILASKPFTVGDFIETDGISGTVSAIDLAYCSVITPDNKEIFVPNSQISAAKIINYNRLGKRRLDFTFQVSYKEPTEKVKAALQEALSKFPQVHSDPAPAIWLSAYGESSISYVVRAWVGADDYWDVNFGMMEEVRESFARNGVEMTFNHLNVHLVQN